MEIIEMVKLKEKAQAAIRKIINEFSEMTDLRVDGIVLTHQELPYDDGDEYKKYETFVRLDVRL